MRKLLYISRTIIPSKFADSVHVMKMCQAFSEFFDTELIFYTSNVEHCNDLFHHYAVRDCFKLNPYPFYFDRGKTLSKLPKLLFKLLFYDKDAVYYGRDLYGVYLAALCGKKVYYESHGIHLSKRFDYIEKKLFKNSNFQKLVVISEKLKEMYLADIEFGLCKDQIIVCHDGADIYDNVYTIKEDKKGFHVGYTGSLYYHGRGIDVIVEIAKRNPHITFHLVGGTDEQVNYWKKKSTVNVVFYGHVPHSEVNSLLKGYDVLLMPYQRNLQLESKTNTSSWMSPMKMFEYMSVGKAIISSNLPVICEVLNDENSVLVDPEDVDGWSNAINKLYCDHDFRNRIAVKAYNDIKMHYTWIKRAEVLKDTFERDAKSFRSGK